MRKVVFSGPSVAPEPAREAFDVPDVMVDALLTQASVTKGLDGFQRAGKR
jgi:hypothetical protein